MKIAGITRVRNEEHIIADTLRHVGNLVDEIYIYDDVSEDNTLKICKAHPKVKGIIQNKIWDNTPNGRDRAEGGDRQAVYKMALCGKPDYIYCFDADEFADFSGIDFTADNYIFTLFDFYITPEDINKPYWKREWIGPEYREIPMLFRPVPSINFRQRIPLGMCGSFKKCGEVRHYGKGFSIDEWEKTCDYYINYFPRYAKKWEGRKGKAVHIQSDFGRPLIRWNERYEHKLYKIK